MQTEMKKKQPNYCLLKDKMVLTLMYRQQYYRQNNNGGVLQEFPALQLYAYVSAWFIAVLIFAVSYITVMQ